LGTASIPTAVAPRASAFENVRAPDAAVDEHRDFAAHSFDHFGQAFERSAQSFLGASTIVLNHQSIYALFRSWHKGWTDIATGVGVRRMGQSSQTQLGTRST